MQAVIIATNPEDRDFLGFILRHAGLAVARTAAPQHVKSILVEYPVDLVLLVLNPRMAAVDEVEEIRAMTQAPILLMVERLTEEDHCNLLDAGADIVFERPVSPRLLSRYVHMLLRRAGTVPATVLPKIAGRGLILDPASRQVKSHDGVIMQRLTPLEFRLLYLLMTNQGQVIPVDTIVERVWGYSGQGNRELVRGLVRRLRRKIEPDASAPAYIENLPGVGYRFVND